MLSPPHTWSLAAIAAVTGVVLLWVWKRFSNPERIALAKRQMRARLYAMRLYGGDPAQVFHAQGQLLVWTARYLAAILPPIAVTIVPLFILFVQLDNSYGHRAPAPGESAIASAQLDAGADEHALAAAVARRGVVVETPGVRLPGGRQICWRVRALAPSVKCGRSLGSPAIEVSCPSASLDVFGSPIGWPLWFLLISLLTMLLLRKRFGVVL